MSANAKCKCGESSMLFQNLSAEEIDGKWESECCLEAPKKASPPAEPKKEQSEEKKPALKKEKANESKK